MPRHEGKVWIAVSDPYDIKEGSASITKALCETSQGVFELEIMQSYSHGAGNERKCFFSCVVEIQLGKKTEEI